MSAPTEPQIIRHNGKPMFVVLPYDQYRKLVAEAGDDEPTIPHDVVVRSRDVGLIRAWREYKGLSQTEVSEVLEITQAAYSQMEKPTARPRRATLEKIAAALRLEIGHIRP